MKVKIALVQDSPVFFNKEKTIRKVEKLTRKCAGKGAQLVLFPETFIPGYPRGFSFGTVVGSRSDQGRNLFADYYNNSFDIESKELKRLEKLSKSLNIYLVIGVTEKQAPHGSLYCSMLYFSPTAGFLGAHRKIKPTGQERVIWAEAGGESLVTFQTRIGRLGGLICWENYMPLARVAMYQQGVQIYLAPTADARESWVSTMQHIALEGRCFVLGCNQYYTKSMYPKKYQSFVKKEPENLCRGGSIIVSPLGKVIAGPLFDKAGILTAKLDLEEIKQSKLDFDPVGHYTRPDIFELKVNDLPKMRGENEK